ncbi:MAG: glycine zipper 2TM domain-containing protein [Granulosicoccus sp.]|nr:glycine zipper 2TM domain-containing protein [Granulosicoccus sp.]
MKIKARPFKLTLHSLFSICLVIGVSNVHADKRHVATERFTEFAKVIDVQPIYREVRLREPKQECWTEQQQTIVGHESAHRHEQYQAYRHESRGSSGDTIVGGLIGGVIGNQLGRGHSSGTRTGATIAGAVIGGAIANEASAGSTRHRRSQASRHRPSRPVYETRPVEKCRRVYEARYEQRLQHYNVTYRYKGRTFTTQLARDPGDRLELQVSVSPARH